MLQFLYMNEWQRKNESMKCIVVEGRSDMLKLKPLLLEKVLIVYTNGTVDEEAMIELLESYSGYELYCFFDRDKSGDKLRKVMKRAYSEAIHMQLPTPFIEVANTPSPLLKEILKKNDFKCKE